MRIRVLRSAVFGALVACALGVAAAGAEVNLTVSGTDPYIGYMNVFDLPSNGGAFQFGSQWGTADLCAVFTGDQLRLSPNTIGDPNPYWYTPSGGPGATGNKIMEANMYVEVTGPYAGQLVIFSGVVNSNTLTASHTAKAFIKDFAPDYSSFGEISIPLPLSGDFAIALMTNNDPARHVQYGFQMTGPNVWITDVAPFGAVVVGPTAPVSTEATTWGRLKSLYR